jgi:hypothetical protein
MTHIFPLLPLRSKDSKVHYGEELRSEAYHGGDVEWGRRRRSGVGCSTFRRCCLGALPSPASRKIRPATTAKRCLVVAVDAGPWLRRDVHKCSGWCRAVEGAADAGVMRTREGDNTICLKPKLIFLITEWNIMIQFRDRKTNTLNWYWYNTQPELN